MHNQLLCSYFRKELFLTDISASSKADVLEALIQPLLAGRFIKNKTIILETLKKREALGSTAIGKGVAIPHCRTLAVSELTIVAGLSPEGIDYDSPDNQPVNLFFLIAAPPQETHNHYLPILGKLVELLREDDLRDALVQCRSFDEFIDVMQKGCGHEE